MATPVYEYILAAEVRDHDRKQKFLRLLIAVIAVPLWVFSYAIVTVLVGIPVTLVGGGRRTILGITAFMMLLLAYEGIRYGKQLFDTDRFARSFFGGLSVSEEGRNFSRAALHLYGVPNPFSLGFVVTQLLYCAPHALVNAWKAHRAIVGADDRTLERAQKLFDDLLATRRWVDVGDYLLSGDELLVLRKLGVLWSRVEGNRAEIRISAALTDRLMNE